MIKYNVLYPTDNEIIRNLESITKQVGASYTKAKALLNVSFLSMQAYLNTCAMDNGVTYVELVLD